MTDTLTIARRFNGPHDSGNGGYSAGLAAQFLPDAQAVEATIRAPIPLDRELRAHPAGDGIDIMTDDASTRILIMSLQPTHLVVPDVKSPGLPAARLAAHKFRRLIRPHRPRISLGRARLPRRLRHRQGADPARPHVGAHHVPPNYGRAHRRGRMGKRS